MAGRKARIKFQFSASCTALLTLAAAPSMAQAPQSAIHHFAIPAGPLQQALVAYADQSGQQLLYSTELVTGRRSDALNGDMAADSALERLLQGTGLTAKLVNGTTLVLRPIGAAADGRQSDPPPGPGSDEVIATARGEAGRVADLENDIVVTGTHIRGRSPGSPPVTLIGRDEMDRRGQATVAQALQALPGNFGGTATEQSTLTSADPTGSNSGFATGVNLRGLGAGATLVLFDGRRIAGSGAMGAFADLSSIPTGALDHVEVLTDGASAIYGSDAVGGVVNILLRRHFEGAETRARFGSVTSGGKRDVQLDQTFGRRWGSGGFMLSYEYSYQGRLGSADRDFARSADSRPFGGTDHRVIFSLPGNLIGFDPATGAFGVTYAIPGGQGGTNLTPGDFVAGGANLENIRLGTDLIPRQIRHSAYAALDQELSGAVRLTADMLYSHRAFDARSSGSEALLQVGPDNPWYVTPDGASSELVGYSLTKELGAIVSHGNEPPRVCRRLHLLREWSHDEQDNEQVFP